MVLISLTIDLRIREDEMRGFVSALVYHIHNTYAWIVLKNKSSLTKSTTDNEGRLVDFLSLYSIKPRIMLRFKTLLRYVLLLPQFHVVIVVAVCTSQRLYGEYGNSIGI